MWCFLLKRLCCLSVGICLIRGFGGINNNLFKVGLQLISEYDNILRMLQLVKRVPYNLNKSPNWRWGSIDIVRTSKYVFYSSGYHVYLPQNKEYFNGSY